MRLIRSDGGGWTLLTTGDGELCLQRLAMRCGYRIGEMCSEIGCTERYMYEVFIRDIGLRPKVWMRRERMVVARRMLAGGSSAEDVSELLGFSSRNNFRREFLTCCRIGPLEFQRSQRENADGGGRIQEVEDGGRGSNSHSSI